MPKHLETKKGMFKKHSVTPARIFNMLPLCLFGCSFLVCFVLWLFLLQAMSWVGYSVEVIWKDVKENRRQNSVKSIFGLWRIQTHRRSSVCTLLLYCILPPQMDLRRSATFKEKHKTMHNKITFLCFNISNVGLEKKDSWTCLLPILPTNILPNYSLWENILCLLSFLWFNL